MVVERPTERQGVKEAIFTIGGRRGQGGGWVAVVVTDEALTLDSLARAVEAARNGPRIYPVIMGGREVYLLTISPRMRAILVMLKAKARWKEQYRDERIARRQSAHSAPGSRGSDFSDAG